MSIALKKELESIKKINKNKYVGKISKSEMIDEIIMMIYKIMHANSWQIEQVYDELQIKDIYQLNDLDEEKLEGILAIINWLFAENGRYCLF